MQVETRWLQHLIVVQHPPKPLPPASHSRRGCCPPIWEISWCALARYDRVLCCQVSGYGGQGESLVPPYIHGSVSLSLSLSLALSFSLTGVQAKAWCLLIHTEASPSDVSLSV